MNEYRRGNNGEIEIDSKTNKPKTLEPNETRFIAIEPSSKSYMFDNSGTYGSASYPKKPEDAKKAWRRLKQDEIQSITKRIYKMGMEIPYFQIASIYISLYGGDHNKIMERIKKELKSGKITIPHMSIRGPKSVSIGVIISNNKIGSYKYFPTTYGNIPLQKGMLILVKLNYNMYIKTHKLILDKEKVIYKLIYPIDTPAVKAAIWKPESMITRKEIENILNKVQKKRILT